MQHCCSIPLLLFLHFQPYFLLGCSLSLDVQFKSHLKVFLSLSANIILVKIKEMPYSTSVSFYTETKLFNGLQKMLACWQIYMSVYRRKANTCWPRWLPLAPFRWVFLNLRGTNIPHNHLCIYIFYHWVGSDLKPFVKGHIIKTVMSVFTSAELLGFHGSCDF